MKKRAGWIVLLILVVILAVTLSDPIRALRISAVLHGCDRTDVRNARFEKTDPVSGTRSVYKATNTLLLDKLTGSGHQTWYVYRFLFVNIPVWAGNG
ncbi:MAG: hypothetical protein IKH56_08385 [Oscillospiraceae bacterium]|nr:hypothetical protein [Oscillospiraceae bacterium]